MSQHLNSQNASEGRPSGRPSRRTRRNKTERSAQPVPPGRPPDVPRFGARNETRGARRSHPPAVATTTRVSTGILIVCILALVASAGGSASAQSRAGSTSVAVATMRAQKDFAGLVDVGGGRQIWASCRGHGSPTVVLLSGHGNGAEDWSLILAPNDPAHQAPGDDVSAGLGKIVPSNKAVYPSVARFTRVCTYDRPDIRTGNDVTTPRQQPHPVNLDVSDLHSLLHAIDEPGPYVLVSHSYGGLISTLFARTYPKSIAGLVMVDTVSEVMEKLVSPAAIEWWDATNAATNDKVQEGVMLKNAFAQINAAPPMPKVPALVLVTDKPWRTDLIPPEAIQGDTVTFADWQAMVNELGASLGATTITKTDSGHNIYLYNPALVTHSIHKIVDDVRTHRTATAG